MLTQELENATPIVAWVIDRKPIVAWVVDHKRGVIVLPSAQGRGRSKTRLARSFTELLQCLFSSRHQEVREGI